MQNIRIIIDIKMISNYNINIRNFKLFYVLKGMEKLGNNVIKSVFMLCFIVISNILPSIKALNSNNNTLSNGIVLAEKKSSKFYKTKTGKYASTN